MLLKVKKARTTKRILNFQKPPRSKKTSYMLHHTSGMNKMNAVDGTTKILKVMMMKTQPMMKRVIG
eukprot:10371313-Prorocentrum_lima.AAC.1